MGVSHMAEGTYFINSEQIGDHITVKMPELEGYVSGGEEIRIHYLEAGVGEPLLLIHGIGQSLYTWRHLFAELSENYRVIAVDLPGHGYSSRPDRFAYSMDEMAALLDAFLEAKGIQSAHMMGFSTGAVYMLHLINRYSDRVANCIAIAPGGISKHMPKLYHQLKGAGAVFARNLFTASDVRRILNDAVNDPSVFAEQDIKQYYEPIADGITRESLMYAVQNFDMKGVAELLHESDHEVLCIWGDGDRYHPASGSVYFQNVLQYGRYYMVKHAGHLVQEEAPGKLLEIVFSYIPPAVPSYRVYNYTQNLQDEV